MSQQEELGFFVVLAVCVLAAAFVGFFATLIARAIGRNLWATNLGLILGGALGVELAVVFKSIWVWVLVVPLWVALGAFAMTLASRTRSVVYATISGLILGALTGLIFGGLIGLLTGALGGVLGGLFAQNAMPETRQALLARMWMDSSGTYPVEAKFAGVREGSVYLELADRKITSIPIDKLSDADQRYVKSQLDSSATI